MLFPNPFPKIQVKGRQLANKIKIKKEILVFFFTQEYKIKKCIKRNAKFRAKLDTSNNSRVEAKGKSSKQKMKSTVPLTISFGDIESFLK